jgi:hypothetical protein
VKEKETRPRSAQLADSFVPDVSFVWSIVPSASLSLRSPSRAYYTIARNVTIKYSKIVDSLRRCPQFRSETRGSSFFPCSRATKQLIFLILLLLLSYLSYFPHSLHCYGKADKTAVRFMCGLHSLAWILSLTREMSQTSQSFRTRIGAQR